MLYSYTIHYANGWRLRGWTADFFDLFDLALNGVDEATRITIKPAIYK